MSRSADAKTILVSLAAFPALVSIEGEALVRVDELFGLLDPGLLGLLLVRRGTRQGLGGELQGAGHRRQGLVGALFALLS